MTASRLKNRVQRTGNQRVGAGLVGAQISSPTLFIGVILDAKNLHNELFDVFWGDYLERCIRVGSVETFRTFHVGLTFVPFELKRK